MSRCCTVQILFQKESSVCMALLSTTTIWAESDMSCIWVALYDLQGRVNRQVCRAVNRQVRRAVNRHNFELQDIMTLFFRDIITIGDIIALRGQLLAQRMPNSSRVACFAAHGFVSGASPYAFAPPRHACRKVSFVGIWLPWCSPVFLWPRGGRSAIILTILNLSGPKLFKVARNKVENASFVQRSAHSDSRIWPPELIEPAAERKWRTHERWPTFKSAYPDPQILPQCNISSNYPL